MTHPIATAANWIQEGPVDPGPPEGPARPTDLMGAAGRATATLGLASPAAARQAAEEALGQARAAAGGGEPEPVALRRAALALLRAAGLLDAARIAEALDVAVEVRLPDRVPSETVGERLRALRDAAGLSVEDVAAAVGLGPSTIRDVEAGRKHHRKRIAVLLAEGWASLLPGQVDASELESEITSKWAAADLLAPDGGYDEQWVTTRRSRRVDGMVVRRRAAIRRAAVVAAEAGR